MDYLKTREAKFLFEDNFGTCAGTFKNKNLPKGINLFEQKNQLKPRFK